MKLCERCRVSGCCLNYLGKACQQARKETCPDVQLNNAEYIASMDYEEMANYLLPMMEDVCEDGIPTVEYMREWLRQTYDGDDKN